MKKTQILLVWGILNVFPSFAQEVKQDFFQKHPFVNITEFGTLLGRSKYETYNYYYRGYYPQPIEPQYQIQNRVNFALQTFNGIYLNKKTAVGLTLGIDSYGPTVLTPISAGIRRNLIQKKKSSSILLGSLDVGYATTWVNEDNTGYKTSGGIVICPTIGYKLPMRNGSAWLINFGYRYQRASYKQERTSDPYWYESNEVRNYRRMVIRFGIEF
ncbi:hypothetical protein EMA8858_03016 [Emticicia aquatica]|uniref:Outer membrane protein beta-barrel domain-containing protein n=1 Tax=Emticicia aquatica TaxID=1681835 RepID=A0ABN8EZS0_9BACT|nr:hypothetical protein [Emticicia aquatica]CAH0996881.1 hypothetical protein EMA8858_03016 [Emticicia aquatica]